MKIFMVKVIRALLRRVGVDLIRHQKVKPSISVCPPDFTEDNIKIYEAVKPYTMTSPERVNALIEAVRYVVENNITGAIVECGVWKGGSMMATALTLKHLGDENRDLYLYDTFSGMNAPTAADISLKGDKAEVRFFETMTSTDTSDWCRSPLDEVKNNVFGTGYPTERFHFVEGKVEDTIPSSVPREISVLRLDTDWYTSTKHELTHLFPLLKKNGVLIIDDYGHWEGARKAVDEYIAENNLRILLHRIDYTGRIAVKA